MKFTEEQKSWLRKNGKWFVDGDNDQEIEAKRAQALYDADMATDADNRRELAKAADKGKLGFSLKSLALTANKDKYSKKNGELEFLDDFFGGEKDKNKRDRWKDKIEDEYGEGSWEKAKKILQTAELDRMAKKIDKDRRDIMEGNAEDQGAYDKFASVVGGILMPRTKQKAQEGKEIEGKDIALDAAESVAMALPFGAATWAGKVATAAAIPLASEVLDDIAYDTENPNDIAERANFSPGDFVVGTLVNLVAPEAMNRALKKAGNKFFRGGEGASSDVMDVVKDLKANDRWKLPKDWKANANELRRIEANKMESDVLSDLKKEAGFLSNDAEERAAIDKLVSTHDLIEGAEAKGNKKLLDGMLDQLEKNLGDDPELRKSYEAAVDYYNMSKGMGEEPDFRSVLESEMSDYYERANNLVRDAAENTSQLTIDQRKKLLKADELRNLYEATEVLADNKTKDINRGGTYTRVRKYPNNFTQSEKIAAGMTDNLDNILAVRNSGAGYGDYMSLAHPKMTHTASYAKDVLNTLAANKAGNQSNVERAVTPIESFIGMPGSLSKPVRKFQTEQRENAKKAQAKAVLNAMANNAKTDEDRKWLGIIAENPGIVRGEGAKALDPEFRKWMLIRGSDILRGTELYRPTFEVE
jgi:hypothetical protein